MFKTSKLDQILENKRFQLESKRKYLLEKTLHWLDSYGSEYGIDSAYVFGSVTQPYRFTDNSDIDVAVTTIKPESYFLVISLLMTELETDVDVIQLHRCHFAEKIQKEGILWTKAN